MATFKKIDIEDGSPDDIRIRRAQAYRAHVHVCTTCSCAEARLRPAKFRCDEGKRLFDAAVWF